MTMGPGFGFGPGGGASALRFSHGGSTGRIQGGPGTAMAYPNPFFDIAHTYLPTTVRSLFRWCRYYFLTNPLINAAIFKMSEYPVTDYIIEHEDESTRKQWDDFLSQTLHFRSFQIELGLDYNTYGNGFVSISYPFQKHLTCVQCKQTDPAQKIRQYWQMVNYRFRLTCPKCGHTGEAAAKDQYLRNASAIKLLRWNPEDIETTYNDVTGEQTYYYTVPAHVRSDIIIGKKEVVEKMPQLFLQAVAESKALILAANNVFHLKRPSVAGQDRGWGTPAILPVLKDLFYLQILKKAQETIALEHILPLRVLFPQASSGTSDPFVTISLVDWKNQVATEIQRWKQDRNYIPILPLPIGNQTIGGDGRALLLTGEITQWSDQILAGLGVPREFVFGGLSYSGSNVSMRMLENSFLRFLERQKDLFHWLIQNVSAFLKWPEVEGRFKPFKMADDLQRRALDLQLNAAGKLSDTTLLANGDYDNKDEEKLMVEEAKTSLPAQKAKQLAQADIAGEVMIVQTKYQVRANQAMTAGQTASPPPPGAPGGQDSTAQGTPGGQSDPMQSMGSQLGNQQQGVDLMQVAKMYATNISHMPPDQKAVYLQNLQTQSPELAELVNQFLSQMDGEAEQTQAPAGAPQVDARPNPEVLPSRRANPSI